MIGRGAVLAAALGMAAAAAHADGFTSDQLGEVANTEACVAMARIAMERYAESTGQSAVISAGSWSISGWDFMPGAVDVTVICPDRGGPTIEAFITGHSRKEDGTREALVAALREEFISLK